MDYSEAWRPFRLNTGVVAFCFYMDMDQGSEKKKNLQTAGFDLSFLGRFCWYSRPFRSLKASRKRRNLGGFSGASNFSEGGMDP